MITLTNKQEVWNATKTGVNFELQGQAQLVDNKLTSWGGSILNADKEYIGSFNWNITFQDETKNTNVSVNVSSNKDVNIDTVEIYMLLDEGVNDILNNITTKESEATNE